MSREERGERGDEDRGSQARIAMGRSRLSGLCVFRGARKDLNHHFIKTPRKKAEPQIDTDNRKAKEFLGADGRRFTQIRLMRNGRADGIGIASPEYEIGDCPWFPLVSLVSRLKNHRRTR